MIIVLLLLSNLQRSCKDKIDLRHSTFPMFLCAKISNPFPGVLAMYELGLSNSDDPFEEGITVLIYCSLLVMVLKISKDLKDRSVFEG